MTCMNRASKTMWNLVRVFDDIRDDPSVPASVPADVDSTLGADVPAASVTDGRVLSKQTVLQLLHQSDDTSQVSE